MKFEYRLWLIARKTARLVDAWWNRRGWIRRVGVCQGGDGKWLVQGWHFDGRFCSTAINPDEGVAGYTFYELKSIYLTYEAADSRMAR